MQSEIAELMEEILRELRLRIGVRSLVLFGSWARGEEGKTSDLDFIVVSDSFQGGYAARFDSIRQALGQAKQSSAFRELRDKGYHVTFSPVPYHPDDLKETPPTLLDVVEDGVIIHDDGTMMVKLKQIGDRMRELGSKRLTTKGSQRYWLLKPDLQPGEVVNI